MPQDGLDLGRVDVEAAAHVHVLQPVGDGDVAGAVHDPDVTGVQPAVDVDGLVGGLGVVEVAPHDVVAAHHDLAGLAPRHARRPSPSTIRTSTSGMARPEVPEMTSAESPRRHMVTVPVASVSP